MDPVRDPALGSFDNATYRVINPGPQISGTVATLGTVFLPAHPIMKGVTSFNGGSSSYRIASNTLYAGSGSYKIANWSTNSILIAARDNAGVAGNKKRVDVNFWPPSSTSRNDLWSDTTDGAKILANSLLYVGCSGPVITSSGTAHFCGSVGQDCLPWPWSGIVFLIAKSRTNQRIGQSSL